jgi:hypothetical protein
VARVEIGGRREGQEVWARWIDGRVQGDREFLKIAGLDPGTLFEDPHAFVELIEKLLDKGSSSIVLDVPRGKRDREDVSPTAFTARTHSISGRKRFYSRTHWASRPTLEPLSLSDRGGERPARTEREKKRTAQSQSCRGERRAGQQEPGRKREIERYTLRDTEREQDAGGGPHAGDDSAGRDGKDRRCGAHADDDQCNCRREADAEGAQQKGAAEST